MEETSYIMDEVEERISDLQDAWKMWVNGWRRGLLKGIDVQPLQIAQNHKWVMELLNNINLNSKNQKYYSLSVWRDYFNWLKSLETFSNFLSVKRLFLYILAEYADYVKNLHCEGPEHTPSDIAQGNAQVVAKEFCMFFTDIDESFKMIRAVRNVSNFNDEECTQFNQKVIKYSRLTPSDAATVTLTEMGRWRPIEMDEVEPKEFNLRLGKKPKEK